MNPKCPYDDKECPKLMDMEEEIKNLKNDIEKVNSDIQTISRYLYLIIGMVAVNWGISLW